MKDRNEPCCVCEKPKNRTGTDHWKPCCVGCEEVWNICFTSASDAAGSLKTANYSRETLERAFEFELKRSNSRKTLRVAIARAIARKIKESVVQMPQL